MINFFKGIAGGIGNIVPGLSGSALLIIFKLYEDCIKSICELLKFKNIKRNILFLFPIVVGIMIGTVLFGNVIKFLLFEYPLPTSFAFFGFILGTIPLLFREANKKGFKNKYIIPFIITFTIGFLLLIIARTNFAQLNEINLFQGIFLGIIMAFSSIIPGISSTVLLTILGLYDAYLTAIAEVDIIFLFPVIIGFFLGGIIFTIIINKLLTKAYSFTFYAIIGFVIATIPGVLRGTPGFNLITLYSIFIGMLSFCVTSYLGKLQK